MDIRDADMAEHTSALVAQEAETEPREASPGEVSGSIDTLKSELVTLPYDEEFMKQMWSEVEAAEERLKEEEVEWDILLKEYIPIVKASGSPEDIKTNSHFRNVHTRLGQLFYQEPELILTARDPGPANDQRPAPMAAPPIGMAPPMGAPMGGPPQMGMPTGPMGMPMGAPPMLTGPAMAPLGPPISREDVIAVKQSYLNFVLGRTGIKALRLMDECLFDSLAWSGIAAAKVGYNCYIKQVPQPKMVPAPPPMMDPMMQPGSVLGLQAPMPPAAPQMIPAVDEMGQPIMEMVPVPVHEEYYCRRFSPKRLLFNADLKSTRYDEDARWLGMIFFLTQKQIVSKYQIDVNEVKGGAEDDRNYEHASDKKLTKKKLYKCYELWPKASLYTDEVHPQAINQLILVEGMRDKPAVWRPSPDQDFDEFGKLTKDSLIGFPIRVLAIRDFADSPYPKADSAFTNNTVKELNTFRQQNIALRDMALGTQLIDGQYLDENDRKKINAGTRVRQIVLKDGALREGADKVIVQAGQIKGTADMYRGADILKKDMEEMLGISGPLAGASEDTVRSATETATVSQGAKGRNDKDMGRALTFYLEIVRMVDQLIMRYADEEDYTEVTGEDGSSRMMAWSKEHVSGRFLYDIAPDSQLRPDSEAHTIRLLKAYNILAPDPMCNRVYFLRRIARNLGLDPFKATLPMPPGMPPGMLPPMGGATQSSPVNKHESTNSGKRENEPGADNFREKMG